VLDGVNAEAADGWTVFYDRFLVSLGHVSAEGDSCVGYNDPDYSRVFDMLQDGSQRVGLLFALGRCTLDFELSSPHDDSVLGDGASEADKALLRTPGTDPYAEQSGVSILVEGHAESAAGRKRFAWPYRHRIDYAECRAGERGGFQSGVDLKADEKATLDLLVRGSTLFRGRLDDGDTPPGFQEFADADSVYGNDDGEITIDELGDVPLADIATAERYSDAPSSRDPWTTLGDYLYLGLFPLVVRYRGDGSCEQEQFENNTTPQ
jgi:hypothetical protein